MLGPSGYTAHMSGRTYAQYCPLAKALDVVGERWTLLVVRELMEGAKRYTDLLAGLPGISTDMLATRLKEMEHAQLIVRRTLPAPAASQVYELTPRSRELEPALMALVRFGLPLLGKRKDEQFRIHWLGLYLRRMFHRERSRGVRLTVLFEVEGDALHAIIAAQTLTIREGTVDHPDVVLVANDVTTLAELDNPQRIVEAVTSNRLRLRGKAEDVARVQRVFGLS